MSFEMSQILFDDIVHYGDNDKLSSVDVWRKWNIIHFHY